MPRIKSSKNKKIEEINSLDGLLREQPQILFISTTMEPTDAPQPIKSDSVEPANAAQSIESDSVEPVNTEDFNKVHSSEMSSFETSESVAEPMLLMDSEEAKEETKNLNSVSVSEGLELGKSDGQVNYPTMEKRITRIHFWSGESGGVGKSTGCKAMIHYLDAVLDCQDFRLIDADRSKPDVKDAYSAALGERCLEGFFSEATDLFSKADEILNAALYGDVVVNLPASVGAALDTWVKNTDLILVAAESNIELIVWFVSNGSPDSMRLFYESLQQWGADVNHVLVRNLGLNRNSETWDKLADSSEYKKAKEQYGFKEFDLPMLYDAAKISGATIPLQNFAANPQLLGIAGASRTRKFLKDLSASFDATGLFERPSIAN